MATCCGNKGTCACKIVAGTGTSVSGTGTSQDPFEISADGYFVALDNQQFDVILLGSGTNVDPYTLQVQYADSAKLLQLPDVFDGTPVNNDVLVWNTASLMWVPLAIPAVTNAAVAAFVNTAGATQTAVDGRVTVKTYSDVATTVTANGALVANKHNPVDATSGSRSMTLANATGPGQLVSVEKFDASANTVGVSVTNLRGSVGSITLSSQSQSLLLVSKADGSWWPVASYRTGASLDASYLRDLTNTATLDFPSIAANSSQSLTITVTGAVTGDVVALAPPAAIAAGLIWGGYVSAANTVTIRLANLTASAIDPVSQSWTARILR